MRTQVENPMVSGDYYTTPAVICPHCGEGWNAYHEAEIGITLYEGSKITTSRPLTTSGKYCIACVADAHRTDDALLEWFDTDANWQSFVTFYLHQREDMWNKPDKEASSAFVSLLREQRRDEFLEVLRCWVLDEPNSAEYAAFESWLMEVM